MFDLILGLTARSHYALRRIMPTTILLDATHTRRGLKWGMPAMLLAVPYAIGAMVFTRLIEAGGPGWLNLLVLLFILNMLKFIVNGPISLIRLFLARWREARARRHAIRAWLRDDGAAEPFDELTLLSR
ncbi:sulfate permease [Cryobacterium frigoriphilum]|uniref:Sulfate permease n=1 Tax=Cryobacterium frigoriphilum TaxID=1259150 RepID=A0A4R8ZZI6_9MICO|nr:sulfate permease [Cryobacterium frigoriphilum]TFD49382.1 sulfate permease [Cryobacterium frigoriphilum]